MDQEGRGAGRAHPRHSSFTSFFLNKGFLFFFLFSFVFFVPLIHANQLARSSSDDSPPQLPLQPQPTSSSSSSHSSSSLPPHEHLINKKTIPHPPAAKRNVHLNTIDEGNYNCTKGNNDFDAVDPSSNSSSPSYTQLGAQGCIWRIVEHQFQETSPWLAASRQTEANDPTAIWTFWMNKFTLYVVHVQMFVFSWNTLKLPLYLVGEVVNAYSIGTPDQGMSIDLLLINSSNCAFFVKIDIFNTPSIISKHCFDKSIPKWTKLVANNENSFASTKIFLLSESHIAVVEWPNANPTFVVPISKLFNDSEITVTSLLDASCRPVNNINQLYLIRGAGATDPSEILLFTLSAAPNVRLENLFIYLFIHANDTVWHS
jgi:hypothetical protein